MLVTTTNGLVDESELVKYEGVLDNENEHIEWVEYCLLGCVGPSHRTGHPDSNVVFCSMHVHRSANGFLKGASIFGVASKLGG